jgi:hypothetical protein
MELHRPVNDLPAKLWGACFIIFVAARASEAQVGRASAFQAEDSGFESHHSLLNAPPQLIGAGSRLVSGRMWVRFPPAALEYWEIV